jgi:hypothetical protein
MSKMVFLSCCSLKFIEVQQQQLQQVELNIPDKVSQTKLLQDINA